MKFTYQPFSVQLVLFTFYLQNNGQFNSNLFSLFVVGDRENFLEESNRSYLERWHVQLKSMLFAYMDIICGKDKLHLL